MANPDAPTFQRLLIARPGALGDVVLVLPAIDALRRSFPGAYVGYVADDRTSDLIAAHPGIDRMHYFPRGRWRGALGKPWRWPTLVREVLAFVRELRAERYDVTLDIQANLKGGFLSWASGAPVRVGYARPYCQEWNYWFNNRHVTPPVWPTHLTDKFLAAVAYLGASTDGATFRVPEPIESTARAEAFLRDTVTGPFAVIHPGSSKARPDKQWKAESFGEIARWLGEEMGIRSIVCFGPAERPLADLVAAASGGYAVTTWPGASVLDLAALLRRAVLFVGTDSGPMHAAAALGVPTVALFGSGSPVVYGPYPSTSPGHRILFKPRRGRTGGMAAITVDEVRRAIIDSLAASNGRATLARQALEESLGSGSPETSAP
ncbi:MAG TPA: glycosyltransferase family 9 protein [Gemmatimonadales bacterium]|nr:glycosyltransferase family 9 protein [Gemmatimonadales bacterium]